MVESAARAVSSDWLSARAFTTTIAIGRRGDVAVVATPVLSVGFGLLLFCQLSDTAEGGSGPTRRAKIFPSIF